MAKIYRTRSCSLAGMEVHDYDTVAQIERTLILGKQNIGNYKAIFCLTRPDEEICVNNIQKVGFKKIAEFNRNHDEGKVSLWLICDEDLEKIYKTE